MEIVTVYVSIEQLNKIVICCIYKSPSANCNDFNNKLIFYLTNVNLNMTFIQLVCQCESNFYYYISNNIYLVFLNILTSSLHINLFTLYVLNTCSIQHLYKIMAVNLRCNTGTGDFVSDTINGNTCYKFRYYLCTKVNLFAGFIFDVAHCLLIYDHCLDALAIMYTNDDQFVPMNAISNTLTNFDFYHLILGYLYLHLYCTYIVNITHG